MHLHIRDMVTYTDVLVQQCLQGRRIILTRWPAEYGLCVLLAYLIVVGYPPEPHCGDGNCGG